MTRRRARYGKDRPQQDGHFGRTARAASSRTDTPHSWSYHCHLHTDQDTPCQRASLDVHLSRVIEQKGLMMSHDTGDPPGR